MLCRPNYLYPHQYKLQWLLLHSGTISSHSPETSPSCAAIRVVSFPSAIPWPHSNTHGCCTVTKACSGFCCHCSAGKAHCKAGSKAKKIPGVNSSTDLALLIVPGHTELQWGDTWQQQLQKGPNAKYRPVVLLC